MQISLLLFLGWVVLIAFWLLNHFFYENQKYEQEYQRKRLEKKSSE